MSGDGKPGNGSTDEVWPTEEVTPFETSPLDINRELCTILNGIEESLHALTHAVHETNVDVRRAPTPHGGPTIRMLADAFAAGRDHMSGSVDRLYDLALRAESK